MPLSSGAQSLVVVHMSSQGQGLQTCLHTYPIYHCLTGCLKKRTTPMKTAALPRYCDRQVSILSGYRQWRAVAYWRVLRLRENFFSDVAFHSHYLQVDMQMKCALLLQAGC